MICITTESEMELELVEVKNIDSKSSNNGSNVDNKENLETKQNPNTSRQNLILVTKKL